jgi:uncharacterized protein YjiS (DUF1127 family)
MTRPTEFRNAAMSADVALRNALIAPPRPAAPDDRARRLPDGEGTVAWHRAITTLARRALVRYRQYRQAKAVRDALWQLDDRMLRDLGFHRDEIDSVAAEVAGQADRTRIQTRLLRTLPGLP